MNEQSVLCHPSESAEEQGHHNGCCLACPALDTVLCTLEQPISFTREQFATRCIVQLLYGIMGQSFCVKCSLTAFLWHRLTQLAAGYIKLLCFLTFSKVNESDPAVPFFITRPVPPSWPLPHLIFFRSFAFSLL